MKYFLLLLYSLLFAPPEPGLNQEELVRCASVKDSDIIDAAIKLIVRFGLDFEADKHEGERNPFPYKTISEFKEKNPDCCTILPSLPKDFSRRWQVLGAPFRRPPRLYAVEMTYGENLTETLQKTKDLVIVNCLLDPGIFEEDLPKLEND